MGFSPQAIFSPYGAPGNFIAWTVVARTGRSTTERPPNRLPEPGRICNVVTPPASARLKPGSSGQTECSAQTWAVFGSVNSFPSDWAGTSGLA